MEQKTQIRKIVGIVAIFLGLAIVIAFAISLGHWYNNTPYEYMKVSWAYRPSQDIFQPGSSFVITAEKADGPLSIDPIDYTTLPDYSQLLEADLSAPIASNVFIRDSIDDSFLGAVKTGSSGKGFITINFNYFYLEVKSWECVAPEYTNDFQYDDITGKGFYFCRRHDAHLFQKR